MLALLATTYALEYHIYLSCALLHHICDRPARSYTMFSADLRAPTPCFPPTCALLHPIPTFSCALEHYISVAEPLTCALLHHVFRRPARSYTLFPLSVALWNTISRWRKT